MPPSGLFRSNATYPKTSVDIDPLDFSSLQHQTNQESSSSKQPSSEMRSCASQATTTVGSASACNEAISASPRHSSDSEASSLEIDQNYWVKATFKCAAHRPESRPRQGWRFDGWRDRRVPRRQQDHNLNSQADAKRCVGGENNPAVYSESPASSHRSGNPAVNCESPDPLTGSGARFRHPDRVPEPFTAYSPVLVSNSQKASSSRSVTPLRRANTCDVTKLGTETPSSSSRSVPRLRRAGSEGANLERTGVNARHAQQSPFASASSRTHVLKSQNVHRSSPKSYEVHHSIASRRGPEVTEMDSDSVTSSDRVPLKSTESRRAAASKEGGKVAYDVYDRPVIYANAVLYSEDEVESEDDEIESYPGEGLLKYLNLSDLSMYRSSPHPPAMVAAVLANVCCLLGLPEDWEAVRSALRSISTFSKQLHNFDISRVTKKQVQAIRKRKRKCPGAYDPETVLPISLTCSVLSRWVNTVCTAVEEADELHGDVAFLAGLKKKALGELARFVRPPELIAVVLGNVHCLLGLDESWDCVRSNLRNAAAFMKQLYYFETPASPAILQRIRRRHQLYPESFDFASMRSVNTACSVLCEWVNAICARADLGFASPTRSMCITPRRKRRTNAASEIGASRDSGDSTRSNTAQETRKVSSFNFSDRGDASSLIGLTKARNDLHHDGRPPAHTNHRPHPLDSPNVEESHLESLHDERLEENRGSERSESLASTAGHLHFASSSLHDATHKSAGPASQSRYRRKQQPKQQKNFERGDELLQMRGDGEERYEREGIR